MILECDEALRVHPLVREMEVALNEPEPVPFLQHLPLFERILQSTLPLSALKLALGRIAADPDHQLPRFVLEEVLRGWTFLVTTQFAISIGVRNRPRVLPQAPTEIVPAHVPRLQPYPFDLFVGCLGGEPYEVQCYTLDQPAEQGSVPVLQRLSARRMTVGSSLALRAGQDMVTSQLRGALVYLEITGPATTRILPQFDQQTHEFTGWISGDATASRLELLTRTLAEFAHKPAVPRLAALTAHQDHYVRWNSLRHLLRLDAEQGVRQLRAASADPNAEIRQLAALTLGRMGV